MEKIKECIDLESLEYIVEDELASMIELFSIQSYTGKEGFVRDYIYEKLLTIDSVYFDEDSAGNLLITKGAIQEGEFYPCLVSHMDTVHGFVKDYKIKSKYTKEGTKLWATSKDIRPVTKYFGSLLNNTNTSTHLESNLAGIGGDDLCGVWVCLKLLEELPILKVVFTVEEESGAIGASNLDPVFFENVGYLIEGDRKGNSDVISSIFNDICSLEFLNMISDPMLDYGYSENSGMLTDIEAIQYLGVNLSAINVSVGYYNPHTLHEYVIVEDLLNATSFIKSCIDALGYIAYPHSTQYHVSNKFEYGYDEFAYEDFVNSYNHTGWTTRKNICNCVKDLTEVTCDTHNKIISKYANIMCKCGEELEEREYTYNCPFCSKIYVI